MSIGRDRLPRDPFQEFIDLHLDMKAIEALDAAAVAEEVRTLFQDWAQDADEMAPLEYLDEAQLQLRSTLAAALAKSPMMRRFDLGMADPTALESLLRLSISLAFAFHAELSDRTDSNEAHPDDDYVDAKRLRRMLMVAMVYARRAALQDDPIARRIVNDAEAVLDDTERLR